MAALAAFGVDAGGVVAGAEVVEVRVGVGEQVPGDRQDRTAGDDDGAFGAAMAGDAPVLVPGERAGLGGARGGVTKEGGQLGVAVAGGALAFLLPGRFLDARASRAQEARCPMVGNRVMSVPISARIT